MTDSRVEALLMALQEIEAIAVEHGPYGAIRERVRAVIPEAERLAAIAAKPASESFFCSATGSTLLCANFEHTGIRCAPPECRSLQAPALSQGAPEGLPYHCTDCGERKVWSSEERKESWMCPQCVWRRMVRAEEEVRRLSAAPTVSRGPAPDRLEIVLRALSNGIADALRDGRTVDNELRYGLVWRALEANGWDTVGVAPASPAGEPGR